MTGRARRSAVEVARDAVLAARGTEADWESTLEGARSELATLEETAGEVALDDPAAVLQLPARMQELRDRILTAERAIAAQRPRVAAAESAWHLAQADVLETPLATAKAALAKHQERTAELLALLTEHEGVYVPEVLLINAKRDAGTPLSYDMPKSALLKEQVEAAALEVRILRELAAGREPEAKLDAYPACVASPGALVPAPKYLQHIARTADAEASAQRSFALVQERVADLEARIARGETAPVGFQDWTLAQPPTLEEQLVVAQRAMDEMREQLQPSSSAGRADLEAPAGATT